LNSAGQLIFQYNAVAEQVEIRSVRVHKSDGNVVAAGPETVQDLSAPLAREAPLFTDARQKHVTVPGLAIGDVAEYDVVINAKPPLAGQFWHIWHFEQRAIALDEQLDLNVPANRSEPWRRASHRSVHGNHRRDFESCGSRAHEL
jgi:hypothetical protein